MMLATEIVTAGELERMGADESLAEWAADKAVAEIWGTCTQPAWMLWLGVKWGIDRRVMVRAAARCARTVLKYVPASEARPAAAIEMAERWAERRATYAEVAAAAKNAEAAEVGVEAADYAAAAAAAAALLVDGDADVAALAATYAALAAQVASGATAMMTAERELADLVRRLVLMPLVAA